jgi:nucleoside-diphosphate-sugar epimerase
MLKQQDVLIVGINNFLGRAIFELVKADFKVTGIFNLNIESIPDDIEVIQAQEISKLKDRDFKYIYLVSAHVPKSNMPIDDEKLISSNLLLPRNIVNMFPGGRIIYCSTVAVYEDIDAGKAISIDEHPSPTSKYALSKLWAEKIIKDHSSYAILRISSMYGIGMSTDTFLPKVIENALLRKEITLLGAGERSQNYIHVDDVASIAVKLANTLENVTLLAVDDQSYTNKQIADTILELVPGTLFFAGRDESPSRIYNNELTHNIVRGLKFKNIKEGLNEIIEWTKKKF